MDNKPSTVKDMVVSLPVYKKFVGETSAMPDF